MYNDETEHKHALNSEGVNNKNPWTMSEDVVDELVPARDNFINARSGIIMGNI